MSRSKGHLSRRRFLGAFLRSFRSTRHEGITWFDRDAFSVETGCLSCAGQRRADGGWDLEITVWRITRPVPGMETVARMNATEGLQQRLLALGIPTEVGGHEIFRSLVGQVSGTSAPYNLLQNMRKICLASSVMDLGCPVPDKVTDRRRTILPTRLYGKRHVP